MKKIRRGIVGLLAIILAANFFPYIRQSQTVPVAYGKEEKTAGNKEEFVQVLYEGMLSGEEEIVINYYGTDYDYKSIHDRFFDEIVKEVFDIDDPENPHDFDYMKYNLEKIGIETRKEVLKHAAITITPKWKESKQEIAMVDKMVKEILEGLNLAECSDYEKVKEIHDYIVRYVEYDEQLEYHTAYDALVRGKATCQGYMLLTYRLLAEAGVPVKCIDGTGTNQGETASHGWNLVKLGTYWYNMDTTWDDPVLIGGGKEEKDRKPIYYNYFLKGNIEFSQKHERDDQYKTAEFKEKYPTSSVNYDEKNPAEEAEIVPVVKMVTADEEVRKEAKIEESVFDFAESGINILVLLFVIIISGNIISLMRRKNIR